jgi:mannosyltransferase OCH1-like enzyme
MPIPRRIFQTWKTHGLPRGIDIVVRKMIHNNPGYEHHLYDDSEMTEFVHKHYPGEISEAYDMLAIGAARADLWRYLILYKYGGVYLDIDAEIIGKLDELIRPDDSAIITREQVDGLFNQWILIFSKGHQLLSDVIKQCVRNIRKRSSNNILHLTGSTVFTAAINKAYQHHKVQFNVYKTVDKVLAKAFNKSGWEYKARFFGKDMAPFARYHNDFYQELYTPEAPQWETEQKNKSIFKDGAASSQPIEVIDIH